MAETAKSLRILARAFPGFLAHGAQLQKGKTGVHGQNHDGAEQQEQHVGSIGEAFPWVAFLVLVRFQMDAPKANIVPM